MCAGQELRLLLLRRTRRAAPAQTVVRNYAAVPNEPASTASRQWPFNGDSDGPRLDPGVGKTVVLQPAGGLPFPRKASRSRWRPR